MNGSIVLKTSGRNGNGGAERSGALPARRTAEPASIALCVFIGVGSALFSLFTVAYLWRMQEPGWSPIGMPPQLWISSALLVLGSMLMQQASNAAGSIRRDRLLQRLLAGGACGFAFLLVQGWAWQQLLAAQVAPAGNAAASFFYLLTAMHGLHVAGGMVLWAVTLRRVLRAPASAPTMVRVCARYLHFLLLVWLGLFGLLGWMTPEMARAICGSA